MNGEVLTRWTVRIALLLFAVTLALRLASPARRGMARAVWTTGCVLFLAHVAAAFHFYHGWSHAHAYRETARRTAEMFGTYWGGGLYLNYLFAALWLADAAWWWAAGLEAYEGRQRWIGRALHAFMLFMAFNGAVIFARGGTRWTGIVVIVALAVAGAARAWSMNSRCSRRRSVISAPR